MKTAEGQTKRRRKRVHRGKSGGSWAKRLENMMKEDESTMKRGVFLRLASIAVF